jgi:uncharacterized protein (TIGR02145 family)
MMEKAKRWIYSTAILGILLILSSSCKKNDNPTTVTDQDGNVYNTVTIGTQVWMVENLKTSKYRNGDPIQNVTDSLEWINLTTGAFCINNKKGYEAVHGYLYNFYAVNDTRNIAPEGWHIPSKADWDALINYLGGEEVAGGKIRESGTTHWKSPNTGATNESGFNALPAGYRYEWGEYAYNGVATSWWSNTREPYQDGFYCTFTSFFSPELHSDALGDKKGGQSIRCIKD